MEIKVRGKVCTGNKIGRLLGYPTANIVVGDEPRIKNGVYAARVEVEGKWYDAMAYLGIKPTISGDGARVLEANIFDFDRDIYDFIIIVELLGFIRGEEKFASFDLLKTQLGKDKKTIEEILRNCF